MVDPLIRANLTDATDALRKFMDADSRESVVVEKQLLQLARLEGVVNLARPFIKTYTHHVQTKPELPACLLALLRCFSDQAALESSCQAVVAQYVNVMRSLQAFVARHGLWTPAVQDAFVELYEAVNRHQFATLLTLMDMCSQHSPACTAEVTRVIDHLITGNATVITLSTNLLTALESAGEETIVNTLFNKCYEWNTNLFFYIGAHVLGPLVGLATGVDWRNPDKAQWYSYFYASVKGVVDAFANTHVAALFVQLFKPPELRVKFTFNLFKPWGYGQTAKGYALYYLDYLYKWNESLTRYVQYHYVQPLLEQALTALLAHGRHKLHRYLEPVLGPVIDAVGKLYIPEVANSMSYLIVTLVLPTLLPYMTYYANVGVHKLLNLLERQVMKYNRHMKYVVSQLPPSPTASAVQEDKHMLQFLDHMVETNKRSWSYRAFKWFIGLLKKDAKKAQKRRIVAYKCVRPQRQCIPVLDDYALQKGDVYYLTAQRCKQKC